MGITRRKIRSARNDPWQSLMGYQTSVVILGKSYYTLTGSPWSLTRPRDGRDLFRFELRVGDEGSPSDPGGNRQRSELQSRKEIHEIPFGQEFWQAWAFKPDIEQASSICGQHHSYDTGPSRSPNLEFRVEAAAFKIRTRSDNAADGAVGTHESFVDRYSTTALALNTWHLFVVRLIYGALGELQVWKDGVEIVNLTATPIGYYGDANGPYPQFGMYRVSSALTHICWYANMEWGTASLLDRVANPLPIPAI